MDQFGLFWLGLTRSSDEGGQRRNTLCRKRALLHLQPPRARPHRTAVVAAAEGHGKRHAARRLFATAAAAVTLGGAPFVPAAHAAPATAQLTRPAIARSIVPGTGRVAKARRRKSDAYDIDGGGAGSRAEDHEQEAWTAGSRVVHGASSASRAGRPQRPCDQRQRLYEPCD